VGSATFELHPKQLGREQSLPDFDPGGSWLSSLDHCHALPIPGITRNRRFDSDRVRGEMTPGHRRVDPADLAGAQIFREPVVGLVGLGDDQETRRIPIQPMDDPGAQASPYPGEVVNMMQKGVDQRARTMSGGWMHDHPGCLVHNE